MHSFHIITVLFINAQHLIPDSDPLTLAESGYLAQAHHGHDRVLIPRMGAGETSVALFEAEYIFIRMILFKQLDLLSDIFKARQHLDQLHIIGPCQLVGKIRRDDRLDKSGIVRQRARRLALAQNIFRNQHAGHISRK